MNASQKFAWYTLAVVALTVVSVLLLIPLLGPGAQGAFGLLGLLGFTPLFFRRRGDEVVQDERDVQIRQRSLTIAYSVFWVLFVLGSMTAPAVYGWSGSVPVSMVLGAVWCGLIVVQGVMALAILIQYRWGGSDVA
jgi:uncharacterized membrane protein